MSHLTGNVLRKMQANEDKLYCVESVMAATELIAARARIAELEQERSRQNEKLAAAIGSNAARTHSWLDSRDAVIAERDALRARLAEFEPRPLREGDEFALDITSESVSITRYSAWRGKLDKGFVRIVRIPIVPRAEEKRDNRTMYMKLCGVPRAEEKVEPGDGDFVRATKAERDALLKVMQDEAQAALEAHPSFGLDDCMRGLPEPAPPAPRFKVGDVVRLRASSPGTSCGVVYDDHPGGMLVRLEDGCIVPADADALVHTEPAAEPVDKPHDAARVLANVDALGAEHPPARPRELLGCMSLHRTDLKRRMAVEIARHRLKAVADVKRYESIVGAKEPAAEQAGAPETGHSTLEGRIAYLEKRLAQYLDDHGETL